MKPPFISRIMTKAEYLGYPAANWSILEPFRRSAMHARYEMLHPSRPSSALDLGDLAHAAILEPGRFDSGYVSFQGWLATEEAQPALAMFREARAGAKHSRAGVLDSYDRQTREGKVLWATFEAQNQGRELIEFDDQARVSGMLAAITEAPFARQLLYGAGYSEVSGSWTDAETGEACKLRLDRVARVDGIGGFIVDLKTSRDASRFERDAAAYGYHGQAAFYLDGWRALGGRETRFLHVVVESEPPHGVRVVELMDRSIAAGRAAYRRALNQLAECKRNDVWPGYPASAPEPIEISKWALGAPMSSEEF